MVRAFIEVGEQDVYEKAGTGFTSLAGWTTFSNRGGTALSRATRNGHLEVCRVLVEEGKAVVNKAGDNGDMPLDWAYGNKHLPTVTFLESVGSEMNWRKLIKGEDWWGAAEDGNLAVVGAFIEVGGGTWT